MMRKRVLIPLALVVGCAVLLGIGLGRPLGMRTSVMIPRQAPFARPVLDSIRAAKGPTTAWLTSVLLSAGLRITSRSLLPGWYHIDSSASTWSIARMLVTGRREPLLKVTIPEGYTIDRIARRLSSRAEIDSASFVAWCLADSVRRRFGVQAPSMEGFLMPDTYFLIRHDDAGYAGEMMAAQAQNFWKRMSSSAMSGGWNERLRLVTLASIVQLEAAVEEEMPTIAGVYANRLRIGMLLQADPTVQYLTGRDRITGVELRDASNRYNTYIHRGLPPGPIGNPGRRALEAARDPQTHEWIFFVARGDSTRRHRFARTLAEHNANVRLYREARRSSAAVSPN
jgi:UPF0755 protein